MTTDGLATSAVIIDVEADEIPHGNGPRWHRLILSKDMAEDLLQSLAVELKVTPSTGGRRRMTTELLGEVADVYNSTPHGKRSLAIKAAFGVSNRTAFRYVSNARKMGLIDG
jgi:hypothetical protein